MITKESEVRNEIKEEIEIFMRGKFQGGEFIFDVSLTNGVRFTNQDYFENRQYFLKQSVDQLHYQSIELVLTQNESQKMLINQMNPSLSIIRISSDKGSMDYQSKMISRITCNENTIAEIKILLRAINALVPMDKDTIIAHGILGISLARIAELRGKKPETIRRSYIKALDHLAFTKGLLDS